MISNDIFLLNFHLQMYWFVMVVMIQIDYYFINLIINSMFNIINIESSVKHVIICSIVINRAWRNGFLKWDWKNSMLWKKKWWSKKMHNDTQWRDVMNTMDEFNNFGR